MWWQEAWHGFTRHPGGGTGAGTFQQTNQMLRRAPVVVDEPHNVPLQFLTETGIVGFLLYLAAAAGALWGAWRARREPAGLALGLGVAAFFVHGVVDKDWNYVATCGPLLFLAGCLVARPRPERARRPVLALAAAAVALAIVYSLAAPWLANRQLASASTVAQVKHARSYDPLSVDALLELAALEAANGNPSSALQHYTDAVKLEPENAQASYELGAFYFGVQAVDARVRRAQQLVHVRPLRPGVEDVRPARSGAREGAQLHAAERAQELPRITTACEALSFAGVSPSTGATSLMPVSRARRRASFTQPGT